MLTAAERAFLANASRALLAIHRRDGSPTCYPMTPLVDDDGLALSTYRTGAKVKRLQRNPHVSVLIAQNPAEAAEWMLIHGTATIVDAPIVLTATPGLRDLVDRVPAAVMSTAASRHQTGKRCLIRIAVNGVERP